MVVLMVFAVAVSIVQLALVGVWSRSIRIATLMQAAGLGLLVVAPLTVGSEWLASRLVAVTTQQVFAGVVDFASWTYDPALEELLKVSPLIAIGVIWPRVRSQLGLTDYLLLGASLGAGFELAEGLFRFGEMSGVSFFTSGGIVVDGSLLGSIGVPSLSTSLTTWLPAPVAIPWPDVSGAKHLIWSALAAAGVGWLARRQRLRWLGLLPLMLVIAEHANYNASRSIGGMRWSSPVLFWLEPHMGELLVVALVGAVVVDRLDLARMRVERPSILMAGERADGLAPWALLPAVSRGLPWSGFVAWQLVLERRAALNARALGGARPEFADEVELRMKQLDQVADSARWRAAAKAVSGGLSLRGLRNWRTVLWALSVLPGVLFLVLAGWPATRGLQGAAATWFGTGVMLVGLGCGVVVVVSRLPDLVRRVRRQPEPVLHEARLRPGFQLTTAATTLVVAMLLVAKLVTGGNPTDRLVTNYHLIDALSSAELWVGLAIILLAFLLFPPAGALMVTTIGTVVVTSSGAALAVGTVLGTTLVAHALLSAASGPDSSAPVGGGGEPFGGGAGASSEAEVRTALRGLPQGKNSGVRTVGSEGDLVALYRRLTQGGRPFEAPGYQGSWSELPDGTRIGLRDLSKTGGKTIDIKFPGGEIGKVHIHE